MRLHHFFMLAILGLGLIVASNVVMGEGGWGPTSTINVTVVGKHVDQHTDDGTTTTNYMVTTKEAGSFEVGNGILLGVWNADEIYGGLREGHRYEITVKGRKVVGFFFQQYPYIVKAIERYE